jgi:HlyD family secretion protein
MKQKIISFFQKPVQVTIASVVIALVIGVAGYMRIHTTPAYQFVKAAPGTILGSNTSGNLTLGFLAGGRIKTVAVKTGDTVKAGDILATLDAGNASGALTQAKAAYATAQANYQKVISGATGSTIDVAKAAVNTAQVNFDQVTKQQQLAVANANRTLLNSTLAAQPTGTNSTVTPPTLSGAYIKDAQGTITITINQVGTGGFFTMSGLVSGTGIVSTSTPEPIADTGISIQFPQATINSYPGTQWSINLPNTSAANYLTNYNAYQSALATQSQAVAAAQASLTQANAALTQLVTTARPEDVAAAQAQVDNAFGALQIAGAAYNNTVITAPGNGTVTSVSIVPGQIAVPNAPAIQLLGTVASHDVAVIVPQSAVISREGKSYVDKQNGNGITEVLVTVGAEDATNVEITSGLVAGDEVVLH